MKKIIYVLILIPFVALSQVSQRSYLPPTDLVIGSESGFATWSPPSLIILDETFTSFLFPPEGWTRSSLGKGWKHAVNPTFRFWVVPTWNSSYALMNDDSASYNNNGSKDYLITPFLDLTDAGEFKLSFDSYFDGAYGQTAHVEISTDSGTTWQQIFQVQPSLNWEHVVVDLSAFSGVNGEDSLLIGFHANDHLLFASGWGIDNVRISSCKDIQAPLDYKIFINNALYITKQDTFCQIGYLEYDSIYEIGVAAHYENNQYSDTITVEHHSMFLAIPGNLQSLITTDDYVDLYWIPPKIPPKSADVKGYLDLRFSFPSASSHIEGGCASDGDYIYAVFEDSDSVYKYDISGNIAEKFRIPGLPGLHDVTYDTEEGLFWGGFGTNYMYKMDFEQQDILGMIPVPVKVSTLAYDTDFDGFWIYDSTAASDFVLVDKSGYQLISFNTSGEFGNYYGLARDEWSETLPGGPYLWGFSRDSSGCLLVQIEIATGLETGFTFDVSYLSQSGGQAAGLYVPPGLVRNGRTTYILGGNIGNDVFFGYELFVNGGSNWHTPHNLLGYDIYRNSEYLDYFEPDNPWFVSYIDSTVIWPGIYGYNVRAVYDLTPEGFPGDTGYSVLSRTTYESYYFGHQLDFAEDWESGSFENNHWNNPNTDVWILDIETGNPGYCAKFQPGSDTGYYEFSLTSYPINAKDDDHGEIHLSFDLKLETLNSTGTEKLAVEFYDHDFREWKVLKEFSNSEGNIDWTTFEEDISWLGLGKNFTLSFKAFGENMSDVSSWLIDNIKIIHFCKPPQDLTLTSLAPASDSILLTWANPYPFTSIDWQYDDSIFYTSIGHGGRLEWVDAAIRWTPQQLQDLAGYNLVSIGMIPGDVKSQFIMKAWSGNNAETLLAEHAGGNFTPENWNFVNLDDPVPIDITQELWVGYSYCQKSGYPMGADDGPCVNWYSNLLRLHGQPWTTLYEENPDLDFNWNILAIFEKPDAGPESYNIYRAVNGQEFEFLNTTNVDWFIDSITGLNLSHCYYLESVFQDSVCISSPGDTNCIIPFVDIDEIEDQLVSIYPNPASDAINIRSASIIHQIYVYNVFGVEIFRSSPQQNDLIMHLDDYEDGIYLLKIITAEGSQSLKFIIKR